MKIGSAFAVIVALFVAGCGDSGGGMKASPEVTAELGQPASTAEVPKAAPADGTAAAGSTGAEQPVLTAPSNLQPVKVESGVATLGPDNTKIIFVGTHVGAKPDPRTGGFKTFSGKAEVDPDTKMLTGVSLEIDTTSLWTEIPKLTDHLKNADFFDVREHPTARFQSTGIKAGEAGKGLYTMTGKLTLHGVTKEISFPALINLTDKGLTVVSKFTIDRSEFGMTFGPDKVENKVALTVTVGEKTEAK